VSADIVIYAIIAAGLVLWLRNVLGTRNGDEKPRPNPFVIRPDAPSASQKTMPAAANTGLIPVATAIAPQDIKQGLQRHMEVKDGVEAGLVTIAQADREFDLAHFMNGAQDVFIMIVEAFAEGDRATLKDFLSEPVYNAFVGAINDRTQKQQTAHVEIHAVRKMELIAASIDKRTAYLTVRFVADETNVLRAADGTLIHGHPDRVTETIDIWRFGRDIRSRNPAWLVMETLDEDAASSDNKTVPDSQ